MDRSEIERKVSAPAIGLMVTGGLVVVFTIINALAGLIGMSAGGMSGPSLPPDFEWLEPMIEMSQSPLIMIIDSLIKFVSGGLIFFGGLQMKGLKTYGLAITACVLSMIPCFTDCCCFLGLIFGIWGLVVLFKPEVKAAFT